MFRFPLGYKVFENSIPETDASILLNGTASVLNTDSSFLAHPITKTRLKIMTAIFFILIFINF